MHWAILAVVAAIVAWREGWFGSAVLTSGGQKRGGLTQVPPVPKNAILNLQTVAGATPLSTPYNPGARGRPIFNPRAGGSGSGASGSGSSGSGASGSGSSGSGASGSGSSGSGSSGGGAGHGPLQPTLRPGL
jgi:hypothetical protein